MIAATAQSTNLQAANFGDDLNFLRKHIEVVVLHDKSSQAQVVVVPAWQGRVMTSTARGEQGDSFGWVNRELISSGKVQPHINSYNDDGKLGRFFELESSSPALALKPGAAATHRQQTMHLQGEEKELDAIAQATLGVHLDAIRNAFKQ